MLPMQELTISSESVAQARRTQQPPPRSTLIPVTAYLDGLRGVAAFFVYTYHYFIAIDGQRLRYAYGMKNQSLSSLPLLRLASHSGPAMVAIFFTISGYVLTVGPLRFARRERWDTLLARLSGSMLTRPVRLFLPSLLVTQVSLALALMGLYDHAAANMCPSPDQKECDFYPVRPLTMPSVAEQLFDWTAFVSRELMNPWDWSSGLRPKSAYGLHLWTIGAEFRCSMMLFAFLAALLPCGRPLVRAGVWLFLIGFCALWQRWDMVAFLAGLGLAVADADENEGEEQQQQQLGHAGDRRREEVQTTARRLIPCTLLLVSLMLCSYPDRGGIEAWGFGLLSHVSQDRHMWHTLGAPMMLCHYGEPSSPLDEEAAAAAYSTSSSLLAAHHVGLRNASKRSEKVSWLIYLRELNFGSKDMVYVTLIVAIILVFSAIESGYIDRKSGRLTYTPVREAVRWTSSKFHAGLNDTTIYRGDPRPELDDAWDELLSAINIRVRDDWFKKMGRNESTAVRINDGKGGYAGMIDRMIRIGFTVDLYPDYAPMLKSQTGELIPMHIDHCIDELRQAIMCRADVTVLTSDWVDWHTKPWLNFNVHHECVDWDSIFRWSKDNWFDIKKANMVHPHFGAIDWSKSPGPHKDD
ncbi:hypothetical protein PpBr36_02070 [Pyricularia pennisetigena]|uniref:hypothetical protein n=1 Tax=Pyricularia pennisetigena TaxID=1578925 RepID=UPI0011504ED4|nr:hypothetical protein PpBr36_02070 [Pyricularia pennisetigena]TLS29005.1 hypothetical protein PpBr36_02070 [Pyricularia pennisetigena]